jgi:endonuclease-3 related protein
VGIEIAARMSKSDTKSQSPPAAAEEQLRAYYRALRNAWGNQHWWPAQSRFEVIAGAYLTQNTSWANVEKAMRNLRQAGALNPAAIREIPLRRLQELIRPAGYFRQKALSLKRFTAFLFARYGGSLARMFAQPTSILRAELLDLKGVGQETADSILLYAGSHPVFVVDAYTRRILSRHYLAAFGTKYEELRLLVEQSLQAMPEGSQDGNDIKSPLAHKPSRVSLRRRSATAQRYNEMHGLLVTAAKLHCAKQSPQCSGCPLEPFLPAPAKSPA